MTGLVLETAQPFCVGRQIKMLRIHEPVSADGNTVNQYPVEMLVQYALLLRAHSRQGVKHNQGDPLEIDKVLIKL